MRHQQFFVVLVAMLAIGLVFETWLPFAVVILGHIWFFTIFRPDEFPKHQAGRFVSFLSLERAPVRLARGSDQMLLCGIRNRRDRFHLGDGGSWSKVREVRLLIQSA